jgi:hypothetical protein
MAVAAKFVGTEYEAYDQADSWAEEESAKNHADSRM